MNNTLNFSTICQDFLKNLSPRQKEIIVRRFGFQSGQGETLESIGDDYKITRERVRQIERDSFDKMEPKIEKHQNIFTNLVNYFKKQGGAKREDIVSSQLADKKHKPHLNFLLTFNKQFLRSPESQEFYPCWVVNPGSLGLARKVNNLLISKLKQDRESLSFSELFKAYKNSLFSKEKDLNQQRLE